MDFEQKKRISNNEKNYHFENLKIARNFSRELLKEMNELVRSLVLFGSNVKNTQNENSDIDIMIVLDNVSVYVSDELREAYRIIINKLNKEYGQDKIHVTTLNLSDLWDLSRKGDPLVVNILRYGLPIFDRDLIEPLQYLLEIGKIRPTRESIYNYMSRSQTLFEETQKHLENATLDLYYSIIDIVHATLMTQKKMPPSPKEMPEIFEKHFKNNKLSKFSKDIKDFYDISKQIEYGTKKITGSEFDSLRKKAQKLIHSLKEFIEKDIETKDNFEL